LTPILFSSKLEVILVFPILKPPTSHYLIKGITDAGWFKDNFSCILDNAVKYSAGLNITIDISMITDKDLGFVKVCVIDSGKTLVPLRLLNLFDPPTQRRRGSIGGMGIGLVCLAERIKVSFFYYMTS
jgi:K+-sensing histidine kinase KdpD